MPPKRGKKVAAAATGSTAGPSSASQSNGPSKKRQASPDTEPEFNKKKKIANFGEGQIAKSQDVRVPLDEMCPLQSYGVYVDENDGVIWDASLNQTNAGQNNNKFYRLQLLVNGSGHYQTWTRWGRVGERGQNKLLGDGSLANAKREFEKKFRDKSGLTWDNRTDDPKPKKYVFLERSYHDDSDEGDGAATDGKGKGKGADWKPPACTLDPSIQKLMELIFSQQYFAATMESLNYDANKLPLGKLSKATIMKGYQALKDLSALLDDPNFDATTAFNERIEDFSNRFYSLIPHAFGRNHPPVIRSQAQVKNEIDLLESLAEMKDATAIIRADVSSKLDIHPLDRQYMGLGMQEMTPLDPRSAEFQHLGEYLTKTRGYTHAVKYSIDAIFRIERQGEYDRFGDFAGPIQDRRLLWHGSRATNFGGILSQGLRIAPPEAPVSGYMFGKGIYLADMSSKSANYCCSYISDNTALLLLCEAELGNPMQHLTNASYTAGEDAQKMGMWSTLGKGITGPKRWKDAACVHPSLTGVQMPDTTVQPGPTNEPGASLQYNEYICYDVAQIRLRYLFRVRM